jgi:hypothetical protein
MREIVRIFSGGMGRRVGFVLLDEHFERCIQKWVRGFFFFNVYNKAQLAFLGLGVGQALRSKSDEGRVREILVISQLL